ncbi:MAG: hypothetical protein ACTS42_00220 [Candidatus Hodgkinia cicadicola]
MVGRVIVVGVSFVNESRRILRNVVVVTTLKYFDTSRRFVTNNNGGSWCLKFNAFEVNGTYEFTFVRW